MKNTNKQALIKAITEYYFDQHGDPLGYKQIIDNSKFDLELLGQALEEKELINFSICQRANRECSDWWLQLEYYSPKLQKTIIFEYDFADCYDNIEHFANDLEYYNNATKEFENKINLK